MIYNIYYSTTETHHPWNNLTKMIIEELKEGTNHIMNRTETPRYP